MIRKATVGLLVLGALLVSSVAFAQTVSATECEVFTSTRSPMMYQSWGVHRVDHGDPWTHCNGSVAWSNNMVVNESWMHEVGRLNGFYGPNTVCVYAGTRVNVDTNPDYDMHWNEYTIQFWKTDMWGNCVVGGLHNAINVAEVRSLGIAYRHNCAWDDFSNCSSVSEIGRVSKTHYNVSGLVVNYGAPGTHSGYYDTAYKGFYGMNLMWTARVLPDVGFQTGGFQTWRTALY